MKGVFLRVLLSRYRLQLMKAENNNIVNIKKKRGIFLTKKNKI
jgi:hypothetical protein